MEIKTTAEINPEWNEYDKVVGANQLDSFGIIFLDEYDCPIDNDYLLDELYCQYEESQK